MTRYYIAFWNLENLFAPEGFPNREEWLARRVARDLAGWTPELFSRKIDRLAHIISRMNAGAGPDLLGVCEVENRFCMEAFRDRLNSVLPSRSYDVVHADAEHDRRGIDTAFVFDAAKVSFDAEAIFSHFVMRRTGTRDITQATFVTPEGAELVAMCNHWPSRSGGHAVESQGFRMTAGETLGYWHERVREIKGPNVALITMGDFNDEPYDQSVAVHANATRERDDVEKARSARLYNLAWRTLSQPAQNISGRERTLYGTLYFNGNGNLFDQIMVSSGMINGRAAFAVLDDTMRIEAFPEMVASSKNEGPIRFGLPRGDAARNVNTDGFSDHFPVSVVIETQG